MDWLKIISKYVVISFFLCITLLLINQHLFSIVVYYTGIKLEILVNVICVFFLGFFVVMLFILPKKEKQKALLYFFLLVAFLISIQKDVIHMSDNFDGEYMHHRQKGLLNKWGNLVVPGMGWFYRCSSNDDGKEIIVGELLAEGNEQIKVYKNEEVISVIDYEEGLEDSDGPSVYDYITENIGKPIGNRSPHKNLYIKKIISSDGIDKNKDNQTGLNSYTDLGPIDCYISNIGDEHITNDIKNIHLYAKSYEGKSLYFIKSKYDKENYHPLTKGSWTRSNIRFNARCSLGSNVFYYVNVSLWDSSGSSSNGVSSGSVSTNRGLQPVQEWVPCPVCGNSLKVGLCQHCNGTGRDLYYTRSYRDCPNCGGLKRCPACGGNGGHNETRYR